MLALTDPGNAAAECSFAISTGTKPSLPDTMRNRGFAGAGMYIHLMQMIGWLMIALFVWLFHGPWLAFKRAVDVEDWPSAGAFLNRIRQIIAVNLPLGLLVVVTGGRGRYWGQLSVGQIY